ncbi:1657_t:CDS:1, partial [Racocetra persica]
LTELTNYTKLIDYAGSAGYCDHAVPTDQAFYSRLLWSNLKS